MCSDPGQELIQKDIREFKLNRVVVASCSPLLHEHTFRRRGRGGRAEPVLLPHGQHPRARLVGAHRPRAKPPRRPRRSRARRLRAWRCHRALEVEESADPPRRAGGRRRHRRHPRGADARQRRQEGLPGRARALHRRPHGEVRQDLPHAGLRGLHPDAQDVRGRRAREHHPLELLRSHQGGRLRRQLHRDRQAQAALRQRGPLRRLPGVHRRNCVYKEPKFPDEFNEGLGKRKPIYIPFPQATPQVVLIDPEGCLNFKRGRSPTSARRPASRPAARRRRSTSSRRKRSRKSRSARSSSPPASRPSTRKRVPQYGYGVYPERLHRAGSRAPGQRLRPDRAARWCCATAGTPKSIGIIHCVGSRDKKTNRWCSRVCCMYSLEAGAPAQGAHRAPRSSTSTSTCAPRARATRSSTTSCCKEGVHFIRGPRRAKSPTGP